MKDFRASLEDMTASDKALWLALSSYNRRLGRVLTKEALWDVFQSRPQIGSGVFEYGYSFENKNWYKRFKKGLLERLTKDTGASRSTASRVLAAYDQIEYLDAVEAVKRSCKINGKRLKFDDVYGKFFGVQYVIPGSGFTKERCCGGHTGTERFVWVRCLSCGLEKPISLSRLTRGRKVTACLKCKAGFKTGKNSSTSYDSKLMLFKYGKPHDSIELKRFQSLGWWTRNVGTLEFIEDYADVMGNAEARAIWVNLHGETL